jgi:small conductance mechanosensitive channel
VRNDSNPPPMPRNRLKNTKDLHLERMFETRSDAWEKVGLAANVSQRAVRRARRQIFVLVPLLIGVLVLYHYRVQILGKHTEHRWDTWIQWVTVVALLALGWAFARDVGRAAGPTFFRRMDPATAGTVGFLIRLATIGITLLIALNIAGVNAPSLVAGSAFTAIVLGLAAQQTLGNLIAGVVLLTARPFRVGERIRLQAGALGGQLEGVVSSLGLLYTTIAAGEDRILVPNNGVLSAVIVPLREPGAGAARRSDHHADPKPGISAARGARRRRPDRPHPGDTRAGRRRRETGGRDHRCARERDRRAPAREWRRRLTRRRGLTRRSRFTRRPRLTWRPRLGRPRRRP